jgi:hypothetical protein
MNIYRFYFTDIDKPIKIEAINKYNARIKLQNIIPDLESKGYFLENLCRESRSRPAQWPVGQFRGWVGLPNR